MGSMSYERKDFFFKWGAFYELQNLASDRPALRSKMRKAFFEHRARMRAFRKARSKEPLTRPLVELGTQ